MSRRVAADKRPKKQNLQACAGNALRGRGEPEVPRGRAESSRRSRDAGERPEWSGVVGEGPKVECLHSRAGGLEAGPKLECLHLNAGGLDVGPCIVKPEKRAFIKTVQNVFFDSYYPKLNADFSEHSGKSGSSSGDAFSRILTSDSLGPADSVASDPKAACRNGGNGSAEGAPWKDFRDGPEPSGREEVKTSDRTSSRSRLTLDSKTYTLFSCVSDVDSVVGKTDDGTGDGRGGREPAAGDRAEWREKQKEATSHEGAAPPSAVDWFAQLCARIETLECLLQQTLVNSFQLKDYKCSEGGQKAETCKAQILVPESSRLESDGMIEARLAPSGNEDAKRFENEDTDNEVRNIKERVKALELKLQQTKMSDFFNSGKPSADFNESTTAKSSVIMWEVRGGEECTCGRWPFGTEVERSGRRLRSCTVSSTSESLVQGGKCEVKTEYEGSDEKTAGKVKKKFVAKCRRIREICNSVASSSRQSSRSFKNCKACNEVSYQQAIVTKEFLETFHGRPPFALSAPVNPDQQKNATLLYVKCQQETLAPLGGHGKRNVKKRKDLCRKTGLTNFGLKKVNKSQQWEEIPLRTERSDCGCARGGEWEREQRVQSRELKEIWASGAAFGWARRHGRAPCPGDVRFEHAFRKNANCDCGSKKRKTRKKASRSPMDILCHGGQIRVPVLFKEVCRPEEPVQKMSNISIRFVMVEEDSKHPLRKLMKKLSQRNSSRRKEKYVFGVSQCCCGDEAVFAL